MLSPLNKENLMTKDYLLNRANVSAFCCVLLVVSLSLPFLRAQNSEITNARITEMTKLGLGDDDRHNRLISENYVILGSKDATARE
jgi:hypothetical protein